MRFIRAYIDGFGAFSHRELGDFSPGLNLISGPNEAGKSTILNFFRSVLFGFPAHRDSTRRYEPTAGGSHGGFLAALDDTGAAYRIGRSPGRLLTGKLTVESEAGTLEGDAAQDQLDRLLAGARKELYFNAFAFALEELSRFDSLSGPEVADYIYAAAAGAGEVPLPRLMDEISGRMGELYKARGKTPEINGFLDELEGIRSELNQAGALPERYTALKGELARLEKRSREVETELAGLRRRERRLDLMARLRARAVRLDAVEAGLNDRKEVRKPPEGAAERLEKIERELELAREKQAQASVRLANKTHDLEEIEVDEPLLEHAPEIETLRDRGQLVLDKLRQLPDLKAEIGSLDRRLGDLMGELGETWDRRRAARFDTGVEARETIRRLWVDRETREKALDASRDALKSKQAELERTERERDNLRTRRRSLAGVRFSIPPALSFGLPAALIAAGIAALLLLDTLATPIVLIVLGLVLLQWALNRRNLSGQAGWIDSREEELRRSLERESAALENLKEEVKSRETDFHGGREAWEKWLGDRGLPVALDRDSVFNLVERVQRIQTELKELEEKRSRSAASEERIDGFVAELNDLLGRIGRPEVGPADCDACLARLSGDLKVNRERQAKRAEIAESARELSREVEESKASLERLEKSLKELLAESGVEDVPGLRRTVAEWNEFSALEAERSALERDLAGEAGGPERLAELRDSIRSEEPEAAEAALVGVRESVEDLERERSAVHREIGSLGREIDDLEQSDRIAELRQREETVRARLHRSSREWARLALLHRLLRAVQEKYERERQGTVFSGAAEYFGAMTGGRYRRVKKPLGQRVIRVETAGGRTVSTDRLSRGTAEQLYLAVRFALIEEYGKNAGALPVLMDDILVNFDPERLTAAAKSIIELSARFQIILFTCHPHIIEVFKKSAPRTRLIELAPPDAAEGQGRLPDV